MGDALKISRDKRHKSSSSINGSAVEGTRSERKLNEIRDSILEVDDQFDLAEARCEDLQQRIETVKGLKKKRKLRKRSSTKVTETPLTDNVPFISVRTQPKKKFSQSASRFRHVDALDAPYHIPPNPTRGYLDPATIEQHQMLGQMHNFNKSYSKPRGTSKNQYGDQGMRNTKSNQIHAEGGDSSCKPLYHDATDIDGSIPLESDPEQYNNCRHGRRKFEVKAPGKATSAQRQKQMESEGFRASKIQAKTVNRQKKTASLEKEERPLVELFNKEKETTVFGSEMYDNMMPASPEIRRYKKKIEHKPSDQDEMYMAGTTIEDQQPLLSKKRKHLRHVKYRSQRYELPTIASQMKQTNIRYNVPASNISNIPFIVTKSTAPSHNIGINIQQVLNSMKIQQPFTRIPSTIAHHMGLSYSPVTNNTAGLPPAMDDRALNSVKVGERLLHLPTYKTMSYSRMLNMYSEGDGMVPRFLKSISRRHFFYTSMYNLLTNRDDNDAATSKGCGSQEAKQSLAEYAGIYREYEQLEKILEEGSYDAEINKRRDQLARELADREDHIRRVVQEYQVTSQMNQSPLRSSASNTVDYRHSTFKINQENQIKS